MPSIGPMEIAILLAIVLIVFGPKRLPEVGKSLGSGIRGFKDSITARHNRDELAADTADEHTTTNA
jgi:sec-independent protein translocase protein TatA